jgi:hypothetical protein
MPKIHIGKLITIEASAEKVKSIITDFNHWKSWSPWLITEPEQKLLFLLIVKCSNGMENELGLEL